MDKLSLPIVEFLRQQKVEFEEFHHPEVRTCEEASIQRGTPLSESGKTMLLKAKGGFVLASLAGHLSADNQKLRHMLKTSKLRFANESELHRVLGYPRGGIPPIARPLHELDLYIDESLLKNEFITFTAGSLTYSVRLSVYSYLRNFETIPAHFAK